MISDMRTYALKQLDVEIATAAEELQKLQDLRREWVGTGTQAAGRGATGRIFNGNGATSEAVTGQRRGRRKMTAAQRKEISERMRASWARRRAGNKRGVRKAKGVRRAVTPRQTASAPDMGIIGEQ